MASDRYRNKKNWTNFVLLPHANNVDAQIECHLIN